MERDVEGLPTMEEAHCTRIPTHVHPPKATRAKLSHTITKIWTAIVERPEAEAPWILETVHEQLAGWHQNEYSQLWEEAVATTRSPPKARGRRTTSQEKTQEEKNAERSGKLAREGQYSYSLQALNSSGLAKADTATEAQMQAKHPQGTGQGSTFQPDPASTTAQVSFKAPEVLKAALSFRRGSAPGPSGLQPEHLRAALKGSLDRVDKVLSSLTKVVNLMAAGRVPESVTPFLCGARLHAAKKKDGGI